MTANRWFTAHPADARASGQRALQIAESLGDLPLRVASDYYLGGAFHTSGDHLQAGNVLRKTTDLLQGPLARERCGLAAFPAAMSRSWLAWPLAEGGEFDEAIARGEEGVRIAEALEHPFSLEIGCWGLAEAYHLKGELFTAIQLLDRGLAPSHDWGPMLFSPLLKGALGYMHALSGRVAEGVLLLKQALVEYESMEFQFFHSLVVTRLAEACLLADRSEDALGYAGQAVALTQERGEQGYEAWALRLLGEIASHCDAPDALAAEGRFRQALVLAEELGMRPLQAHCHLGLGKLFGKTGARERAQEHLATAMTVYRDMDMTFWLEKAQAEMVLASG